MPVYYDSDEYAPEETNGYSFTFEKGFLNKKPYDYRVVFKKNNIEHRTDGPAIIEWNKDKGTTKFYSINGWGMSGYDIVAVTSMPIHKLPPLMNSNIALEIIIKDRLEGNTGITLISSKSQSTLNEIIRRATETPTQKEIELAMEDLKSVPHKGITRV